MNKEDQKITITQNTTFWWDCPECDESNEIEYDGDCFPMPAKCEFCGKEFKDYLQDF